MRLSSTRNLEISSDQESCTSNDPRLCALVAGGCYLFVFVRCVTSSRFGQVSTGTRANGYAYRQRKRIDFSLFLLDFLNSDRGQLGENPVGPTGGANRSTCSIFTRPRQPERFKAAQITPPRVPTSYVRAMILP